MNLTADAIVEPGRLLGDDPAITVWVEYPWAGVDRPRTLGFTLRDTPAGRRLAGRLSRAINAGAVMHDAHVATDVYGKTYVAATSAVLGRRLGADLRRLGY